MEKVLIIAYFYPPCNLTASARPAAWAKYLPEFGFTPIVLTRNWQHPVNSPMDISRPSGTEEVIEQQGEAKIIYLPYAGSLKDRLYAKYGDSKYRIVRKALSFLELVLQNFTTAAIPFSNIYTKAESLIAADPSITKVIITANPFVAFFFGYLLKKKFPQVKWVADYRDDWSTSELNEKKGMLQNFIATLEEGSEKKWVSTASVITSISPYYVQKISRFTGVEGKVLLNGFTEADMDKVAPAEKQGEFVITYNGTLYPTQNIEIFLEGFKKAADKFKGQLTLKLNFPGLAFDRSQSERVKSFMKGYEELLNITERIPRQKVFEMQNASHAFLMVAHGALKGIPSSKLYEYLCFRKPVILCPDDNDIIHETLADTGLGVFCNSPAEVERKLTELADDYIANGKIRMTGTQDRIMSYSRRNQAQVLAGILKAL